MGPLSALIRYLVAPIPIQKQATDVAAVMTCICLAREGGTIAIAPEGNRTYSGKTVYINPAIAFGFPMLLLATLAPKQPYLTLGIFVAFFAVMNIILFRSVLFRRKKK